MIAANVGEQPSAVAAAKGENAPRTPLATMPLLAAANHTPDAGLLGAARALLGRKAPEIAPIFRGT
eukprot:10940338-Lingulodinium_polyedra.AAC.1